MLMIVQFCSHKDHIDKASSQLRFLYRQAHCLNQKCDKLIVSNLMQFHVDYTHLLCILVRVRLQTTQNKMVRFILNSGKILGIILMAYSNEVILHCV